GAPIGKPGVLHRTGEIYGYYRALAASSPRVRFQELGPTEEGNRMALVQVGSERNLARLDSIEAAMDRLADPRVTSEAEAERLMADLPVIYTFLGGLHSTETGPSEMLMELAYRLASSNNPDIQMIRDSALVFIVPVTDVDGRNRVVDWHRRFNQDAFTEDDRVPGPPYWGHYIMHDDNRDGLQMSAALTRELIQLALKWHPPFVHDLHESIPYLYTATGTGPYNPLVDPIGIGEWQWLANYEVATLTAEGLPGVWTHGFYDGWYPGYLMWVMATDLNGTGRFYETFGNSVPNTMTRTLGGDETATEWYRPSPPRKETIWSLRNNTNYMESGALAALGLVAKNRTRLLDQYWTKTKHSLEKGRTEKPYAWVIPAEQPRSADAAAMLENLRFKGIEVSRATDSGDFDGVKVKEGDYLIRMDQPLRSYAQTLMQVQHFPTDAPTPYDDVGWTFPLMYHVEAHAVDDPAVRKLSAELVTSPITIPGTLTGRGDSYLVEPTGSARAVSAWFSLKDVPISILEKPVEVDGRTIPAGAWVMDGAKVDEGRIADLVRTTGLRVHRVRARDLADVPRHAVEVPRIALLHSWRYTQDDGSVRYAFDQLGVPYTYLGLDKLAGSNLRSRFDVVIFPSQGAGASATRIFQGVDPKWGPLPYESTPQYPSLGLPDSSADITGGMGYEGLAALRDFVDAGGTLITLGSASTVPIGFGMVRGVSLTEPRGLFIPGSILRGVVADSASPLVYGYGERAPIYHRFGPYFRVSDDLKEKVVMRYASADALLLSGLAKEPGQLAGDPAIVALPVGKGEIVLFGFDPLHRYQSQGDFALVWNALMNWNDLEE
ncbi:MAG TPA: M14 family zinc carboxypeptidase, partial [Longimicrobiaceae bacterium]|nr:M14 family zinc carboxypeptidase [Longimicrobiaceae bacterium]